VRWNRVSVVLSAAVLAVALLPATALAGSSPDPPRRVLIVVIDQLLPEYVDRFDMRNVRALMDGGVNFDRALLGHMAAETVITHNVLTSGLFPKHMGWSNEVFRDVDNALGEGPGAYHVTSSLSCSQFNTLLAAQGYPKLDDHLGGKFVAIGQKTTAACPAGHPADPEDIVVHIGSRNRDCDGDGVNNWRSPGGANIPAYIATPNCGRFYVDASSSMTYGTGTTSPAWMYPLDGNRFAVGNDPAHLGGDVWTADAAIEVMKNEADWKGMLVSFGSVDKMAHMWGTDDAGPSGVGDDVHEQAHLPFTVRTADEQVGRLMAQLEAQGLREETLVVLTTDHAGQTARRYHGLDGPDRGNFNWYYGQDADETYLSPQPALAPLVATGNLDFSYQDGHIAVWAKDRSPAALRATAAVLRGLPEVIASYVREGDRYRRVGPLGSMNLREFLWWRRHAQRIIDTMAAPYGPDVVGLLRDDVSYGVKGDHGGHQRQIQRIPMVFSWPGLKARERRARIRAVDVLPTVLELMDVEPVAGTVLDGRAYRLKRAR
jgi:Type I phosphodiesterase / nucleotide pyrophosphatase